MRVFVYFSKENVWVVDEERVRVVAQRLFIDGEQVEELIRDIVIGYVAEIIPRNIKDQYIQGHQFVYEAEEAHLYTLPYLFLKHFRDEFEEPEEMAIRVKEVKDE